MKCHNCDKDILDDSKFCPNCGEKLEEHIEEVDVPDSKQKKSIKTTIIYAGVAIVGLIIAIIVWNSTRCELSSCNNEKDRNKDYCYEHSCPADGCNLSKWSGAEYCFLHLKKYQCSIEDCENIKIKDSEYCYYHTCKEVGCVNLTENSSGYCSEHIINMRERLTNIRFNFSLNSAGGIEFYFNGFNATTKDIKYIRFNLYLKNRVGDTVYEEITREPYAPVEIIGRISGRSYFSYGKKVVGYAEDCYKIIIDTVTITYMDGTSETGELGYYKLLSQ